MHTFKFSSVIDLNNESRLESLMGLKGHGAADFASTPVIPMILRTCHKWNLIRLIKYQMTFKN